MRSRRFSPRLRLAVLASAFLAVFGAAPAQADVAYVGADKEVWISSLDGAIKERLSAGESEGEVKWFDTAQSDTGWVVGVRNIPGRSPLYSTFTVWNPQGAAIYNGPLAGETTGGLSAYPLSLDLTNDGRGIIYGFSTFQQWYGGSSLTQGHYFLPSETVVSPVNGPLKQINKRYPTLFGGSRVVAALDRTLNGVQDASSIASETFVPWLNFSGVGEYLVDVRLRRTDVAASGRVVAFEVTDGAYTVERIGVLPVSAIGADPVPGTGDCFLRTDGNATSASLSQDGSAIAWTDSGGVKVGGIPDFSGLDPCVLTRPAVTIAAGGQFPSIGAMSAAAIRAARSGSPGGGTGGGTDDEPGGGTDDTPASKPLIVTLPAKVTAAALTSKAGLPLKVTVPAGGKIAVTASVPASRLGLKGNKAVVIATGSASPKSAGQVSVKLRLNAKGRKYRKRLRGLTLTLKITQGAKTTTKTIRLR